MFKKIFCILSIFFLFFTTIGSLAYAEDSDVSINEENNVIIVGNPDDSISQDLYINVKNKATKKTYIIYLYQLNNYQQFTYLPEGDYKVIEGGKINDLQDICKVEYKEFTIEGSNTVVKINFGKNVVEEEITTEKVQSNEVKAAPKEISGIKSYTIFIIIGLVAVGGLALFFLIKKMVDRIKSGGI